LNNALPFSLPRQCNVENEVKLQLLVFNTVCGAGGGGVKLGKCSYICVWRVLASAQERIKGKEKKAFVYDSSQVVLPGVTFSEHTIMV